MKKLILIFSLFLTCQFLTGQMTDNVDPWYTDNDTFGDDTVNVYLTDWDSDNAHVIYVDTTNHLATRIFVKSDTTAILMLVTDCDNCPAHAEKGYLVDYPVRIYLDEYKNPLKSNVNIWQWEFREEKIINTGQILKAN